MSWVYDKDNDRLVPKGSLPPKRNHFGTGPAIIGDEMPPMMNHVDGKQYTSKRAFEREVRAHDGCEIVGNEDLVKHTAPLPDPTLDIIDDIQKAWSELGGEA